MASFASPSELFGRAPYDVSAPIAIAHRGGAGDWPENTLAAFEGAARLGYRFVETDVHVTADGVLVAFHDDRLDRVTDRTGVIRELPWSEVSAARVEGRAPIVRFDELLASFPDLRLNIDPKHDDAVEPLISSLRSAGALNRVCIGAFSDRRLDRVRTLAPEVATSMGPRAVARLLAATRGVGRGRFHEVAAQVPPTLRGRPLVTRRFVEGAHRMGVLVHVWTIDDADEMERLLNLGVDGIMTDRPAVLREVLERRGQWA